MHKWITGALLALTAWMIYWANDYRDANQTLIVDHALIANEFERFESVAELSPAQNDQLAKEVYDRQRDSAEFARDSLSHHRAAIDRAETMLISVSTFIFAVILGIMALTWMLRFRLRIERREELSQAVDAPSAATV